MHTHDLPTSELVDELLDESAVGDGESEYTGDGESDLALELLSIQNEEELDQFFGKLFKRASSLLKGPAGKLLKSGLGGLAKRLLPMAGSALGNMVVPGIGGALGGKLAGGLGSVLGLEAEAVAPEEMEEELARAVVRTAQQAARYAARNLQAGAEPARAVRTALNQAIARNLPGLVAAPGPGAPLGGRSAGGRWRRFGRRIVLYGV